MKLEHSACISVNISTVVIVVDLPELCVFVTVVRWHVACSL